MLKARITNGQLVIEGVPSMGLSSVQLAQRQEKNLWKVDTVYCYRIKLPKYLADKAGVLCQDLLERLRRIYGSKLSVNKEVGVYFINAEDHTLNCIFFAEGCVYNWSTAREFRSLMNIGIGYVKRPYHAEWKEMRRSANQASYVKPSQTTISDN